MPCRTGSLGFAEGSNQTNPEGHLWDATRTRTRMTTLAMLDDPNLVSSTGLVPLLALADSAGVSAASDDDESATFGKDVESGRLHVGAG